MAPDDARERLLQAREVAIPGSPEAQVIDARLRALDQLEQGKARLERSKTQEACLRTLVQQGSISDEELGKLYRRKLENAEDLNAPCPPGQ